MSGFQQGYQNSLAGLGYVQDQIAKGEATGKQNRLATLTANYAAGGQPDYQGFASNGGDPMALRADAQKQAGMLAGVIASAPTPEARASLYAQALPHLQPISQVLGQPLPAQWSEDLLPETQAIAQHWGGQTAALAPRVVNGALVGPNGQVLYQSAPKQNLRPVAVPDGQGGSQMMNFDPSTGQYSPMDMGGEPTQNNARPNEYSVTFDGQTAIDALPPAEQAAAKAAMADPTGAIYHPGPDGQLVKGPSAELTSQRIGYKPPPAPKAAKATAAASNALLTPEGNDLVSTAMSVGYSLPLPTFGMGTAAGKAKADAINALAKKWADAGISPQDGISAMIQGKTATSGLTTLQKTYAGVAGWEESAKAQAKIALNLSNSFDRTNFPLVNRAILAGYQQTGDPRVDPLVNSVKTLAEEYAKVIGAGNAAATDSARELAHEMFNTAQSKEQFVAVVDNMMKEMAGRTGGLQTAISHQRSSVMGRQTIPKPSISPEDAALLDRWSK